MTSRDVQFQIDRSWAAEPLFYRAPCPPGDLQPRSYQEAGAEYALARNNCLIGDAPGLGKSCQGVLISNSIEAKRTLIVCPASLRLNWEREVWKWSTIPNVRTYPVLKASDGVSPQAHYNIISYDLLRNEAILRALLEMRFDHAIYDEAHYLKDPKGNRRTKALCAPDALPSVVGRLTMLSGTILPNQPIEVFNAARLLDWSCIDRMSEEDFRDYYYDIGGGFVNKSHLVDTPDGPVWKRGVHWSTDVRNVPRNLDELRERLRSRVMVRRLKEHVMTQLPRRQWHVVPLGASTALRKVLKSPAWQQAERLYQMDPDVFDAGIPIDGAFSTAWRELGEAKVPDVLAYARELLDEGVEKLVVGAWHHSVLDALREGLESYGLVYMDGRTSARQKQAAVDRFQAEPQYRVILGQMQSMGEGWTLTAAQDALLAEPHPVPGKNEQFFDRIHREGQKGGHAICHVPVAPDSLDERMLSRAILKDVSINQALDGL